MLTKLMKYEWMATARYLVPLYLAIAFISILTKVTFSISFISEHLIFVPPVIFFIYILSLVVLALTTLLLIIMRFYKNLLTGEGYLMFSIIYTFLKSCSTGRCCTFVFLTFFCALVSTR